MAYDKLTFRLECGKIAVLLRSMISGRIFFLKIATKKFHGVCRLNRWLHPHHADDPVQRHGITMGDPNHVLSQHKAFLPLSLGVLHFSYTVLSGSRMLLVHLPCSALSLWDWGPLLRLYMPPSTMTNILTRSSWGTWSTSPWWTFPLLPQRLASGKYLFEFKLIINNA